jgi:phospholipase D1/2
MEIPPISTDIAHRIYIDAKEYFADLAILLPQAKSRILIAGWVVAPQVWLIRDKEQKSLLDILRTVDQKVEIYVLIWKERGKTHPQEAKKLLQEAHPNVKVMLCRTGYQWSHHQKLVVIDDSLAFIGGIDLGFGRWDTDRHDLFQDPWPENDFRNPWFPKVDRGQHPRMPWHDVQIALGMFALTRS